MGNSFRVDRVGMEIKREVNEILQKKVRDPRVQDVTITDVQMLGDLSAAKIFYTIHSSLIKVKSGILYMVNFLPSSRLIVPVAFSRPVCAFWLSEAKVE